MLGEKLIQRTWDKTYQPYFDKLIAIAGQQHWASDAGLLDAVLRTWAVNTRSRQIAHDKLRRLWKQAIWDWQDQIRSMRGNGAAAKPVAGVKGFKDAEVDELRLRIKASYGLTDADLVEWDVVQCFGLRPKELQFFSLAAGLPTRLQGAARDGINQRKRRIPHRWRCPTAVMARRLPRPLQAMEKAWNT